MRSRLHTPDYWQYFIEGDRVNDPIFGIMVIAEGIEHPSKPLIKLRVSYYDRQNTK